MSANLFAASCRDDHWKNLFANSTHQVVWRSRIAARLLITLEGEVKNKLAKKSNILKCKFFFYSFSFENLISIKLYKIIF